MLTFSTFNISDWKLTLPVDLDGTQTGKALDVYKISSLSDSQYFHTSTDGAVVFSASVGGATTPGSPYARSELREMTNNDKAAWAPRDGGVMTATLSVEKTPTLFDGTPARLVVGQIHGVNDELVRLYYDNGHLFFVCDYAGPKNQESFFNFRNASGVEAPIIALGDKFSYKIEVDASTNMLSVTVYVNGEAYSAKTAVNDVWQNDALYFKAGVYLGTNETTATGSGEVAFYALDYGHSAGMGLGGLQDTSLTASTVSLTGGSDDDVLHGGIKNDVLNGGDGNDILNGYDGNDKLSGGNGNDLLNGGTGSDTMAGGAGDDTYYVDSSGDVVSETSGNGTDIVIASINYTLASNVENLTLAGSANLNGTGNNLANLLLGNDGDNVLDGAGGADTMRGFDGNDTYYVNTTKDVVIEQMGDGKDLVISTVNYTLSNYVEALTLAGTADLNGTGNAQNNTITGNAGNNKLDGAGGVDTMAGGTGDDIYYADSSSDKIVEYAAQGYDTVRAAASFTLRDNVEALYLMGTDNINGTGNGLANLIDGNGGVNILNGGLGNDTLKGDGGADQFVFNTTIVGGRNVDHITDFKTQWDSIDLDHLIFGALSAGHLTDNAFAVGRAATTADQHIIYDAASGALYYDPDGVGGQAQIQFAVLDHAPSLSAADFTIF